MKQKYESPETITLKSGDSNPFSVFFIFFLKEDSKIQIFLPGISQFAFFRFCGGAFFAGAFFCTVFFGCAVFFCTGFF